MYTIEYAEGVIEDLAALRAFDRAQVLDHIEEQLTYQPMTETRNKKKIIGLSPPWEHQEPVWELRVQEFRVFYDVDTAASKVTIRAVRRKPPHATTEQII